MNITEETAVKLVENHGKSPEVNEAGSTVHCIDNTGGRFTVERLNSGKYYIGPSDNKQIHVTI